MLLLTANAGNINMAVARRDDQQQAATCSGRQVEIVSHNVVGLSGYCLLAGFPFNQFNRKYKMFGDLHGISIVDQLHNSIDCFLAHLISGLFDSSECGGNDS
jgi:hypothetical protein